MAKLLTRDTQAPFSFQGNCVEKHHDFSERCVIYYFTEHGKKVRMDLEHFLNFDSNPILV